MKILPLILTTFLAFGLTLTAQDRVDPKPTGKKAYPTHWGKPPLRQTRDLRQLPGDYGKGSGTLAKWIAKHMEADKKNPDRAKQAAAATAAEIQILEKDIASMKNFMARARFTPEGLVKYKAKLKKKEDQLAALKMGTAASKKKAFPLLINGSKAEKKSPRA